MADLNLGKISGKLGFFKDYSSLLLPIIIAVIGIVVFIPTHIMSGNLKKEIERDSISLQGKRIQYLKGNAVSSDQWQSQRSYQNAYREDANRIAVLVEQSGQRQLLSYKIFPEPRGSSTLVFEEFGQEFRSAIDRLITQVNARDCPTEAELNIYLKKTDTSPKRYAAKTVELSGRDAIIMDEICREKAAQTSVYINPIDVSGYEFWEGYKYDVGMKESIEDCWYWQLGYWIIEDVIQTIDSANSGSAGVFTSGVKRLLWLSFSDPYNPDSAESMPFYVAGGGLVTPFITRVANKDIDVVHFAMSLIVDSKSVLMFMKELCSAKSHSFSGFDGNDRRRQFRHNQITVLESRIKSIDRKSPEHAHYRYGEEAVFEMNLVCEYIFNKVSYDCVKPVSVKEAMGSAGQSQVQVTN